MKDKLLKRIYKRFNGLSNKMLRVIGYFVALAVIITAIFSLFSMNSLITEITYQQAVSSADIMKEELNKIGKTLEISAKTLSVDKTIIEAILTEDTKIILEESKHLGEALEIENITVTDAEGIVLASTNDIEKEVNNIAGKNVIQKALEGNIYSDIIGSTIEDYAINAAAPIYNSTGEIIGTASVAYNFNNTEFVDNLKELTGNEFTVFAGDVRINTTIISDGQRVVGTNLNPKTADVVINQKQEYIGEARLFGKNYITAYYPILSSDGSTVTGILFSGRDNTDVEHKLLINILMIAIIAIFVIILSVLIGAKVLKKGLKIPIEKVVNAAKAIEIGDVNNDIISSINGITSKDEIGLLARSMEGAINSVQMMYYDIELFNKALAGHDLTVTANNSNHKGIYKDTVDVVESLFSELGQVLKEIKIMADGIDGGSSHVSAASQSLAQGSTEQASATEELTSTIVEISQQISENANNADKASILSMDTNQEVKVSSDQMSEMMKAMDNINTISKEISKIIKAIDDIAFQTNILALNAAVEAARAGSHGKGFAVVADEVRNLANKSAEAAKSTAVLIENSIKAVENGSRIAKATEQALYNVADKTNKVNEIVYEIAEAAKKQEESINQINTGINQISDVVQANSATSEETAAASEELSAQAQSLYEIVSIYKMKN
ncbi:MAG: methyl-accepting chemotaxis protein [Sedimentibacter sp.]|uniref:methyl-accepting chemotaxis protein n=1 Tax=Sedimentibacter sp. TaxID=1960295 RepID=UPI00298239B7|nr:methyl-accepting chemotaxis protein [Sedimentibacter sp.]MDW5298770.1 methyl-accepting chemotaxis protein [Sedimentibacter sp.]